MKSDLASTLSCDLTVGDALYLEEGRIVVHLEAKSGSKRARLRFEFAERITVEKRKCDDKAVVPGACPG